MSGVDVGLAVAGLVATLFTSVVQSYYFLRTAEGLARDAPIAYWKLRIQEMRLQAWGEHWGVEHAHADQRLEAENIRSSVIGILGQMKYLLEDSAVLQSKYGMSVKTMGNGQAEPGKSSILNKFRWAMLDKAKVNDLIADLKALNDGLDDLLRLSERISIGKLITSSTICLVDTAKAATDFEVACTTSVSDSSTSPRAVHWGFSEVLKQLQLAAGSKRTALSQQAKLTTPKGIIVSRTPSNSHQLQSSTVTGYPRAATSLQRTLCDYAGQTALLEWKPVDANSHLFDLIQQRIENLAELLSPDTPKPDDFRVLNCIGYFMDESRSRYGYVYAVPPSCSIQPPYSLHEILSRNVAQDKMPDLGSRFVLARALCSSILVLHACGWTHTSFRSEAVIFFHASDSQNSTLGVLNPYILGFGYSKPADPAESTIEFSQPNREHDLYRHPELVVARTNPLLQDRLRHQQRYDLYSLGIVLLEIGLWEQVESLWKSKYSYAEFQQKLLRAYVPRLGSKMGLVYRDVVRELLSLEIPAYDERIFVTMRLDMGEEEQNHSNTTLPNSPDNPQHLWNIVRRLEHCQA